ncbi:lysylphosphatidylglycerol synthase transmembrane domain-containing protein [Dyella sp. S184]|uniref:lysylphosphatidylglycerol synthase transmembrane domain-containing protein n=1 Tax=Dyella sp. S184 TaxID=1641862 RepID=UPI00131C1366|nr:lysylphosphatidylglycerol synthase transmembrane domain-containing protein [Dyella sp. S184]
MSIGYDEQPEPHQSSVLKRRWRVILTLCGFGLLAGMIAWAGPVALWDRLRMIDPACLAGAIAAIVAGTLLSAINSYLICGASQVMGLGEYVYAFWVAWAIGLVVPGQIGDMLTLNQVLRRRGMPLSHSVARTTVDKVVSLLCALMVASQIFRLGHASVLRSLSAGAIILLAGMAAFAALSLWALHRMGRMESKNRWVVGAIATAAEVVRIVITRPRLLVVNLVLSLLKVGLTGISYWLVIRGLSAAVPPLQNVTIAAISSGLVAYLPLSANGIGTVEVAGAGLFGELGIGLDIVLSMYLVLRLVNILLAWVPAMFVLPDLLRTRKH